MLGKLINFSIDLVVFHTLLVGLFNENFEFLIMSFFYGNREQSYHSPFGFIVLFPMHCFFDIISLEEALINF